MESKKCKRCPKVIEGYTENHVDTLMAQHMIKHDNEDKRKRDTNLLAVKEVQKKEDTSLTSDKIKQELDKDYEN